MGSSSTLATQTTAPTTVVTTAVSNVSSLRTIQATAPPPLSSTRTTSPLATPRSEDVITDPHSIVRKLLEPYRTAPSPFGTSKIGDVPTVNKATQAQRWQSTEIEHSFLDKLK